LEGTPENERDELKREKIDEDFGLLELATNAGRSMKKKRKPGILYCILFTVFVTLGIDRIRLMARMKFAVIQQSRLLVGLSSPGIEKNSLGGFRARNRPSEEYSPLVWF